MSGSMPSPNEPAKDLIGPHSTAKTNDKAQISGRMVSSGIRDVAIASVQSEKKHLKKLIVIIILNKSQ